jgi:hypothetical protein
LATPQLIKRGASGKSGTKQERRSPEKVLFTYDMLVTSEYKVAGVFGKW